VPNGKAVRGYRYEKYKFETALLTPVPSETVAPPRALECPVHLEARVEHFRDLAANDEKVRGRTVIFEVRIPRVHLAKSILWNGDPNRIDPDKWRPLIMSFQKFYGLAPDQVHASRLSQVPEALYRSPDVDRARAIHGQALAMSEPRAHPETIAVDLGAPAPLAGTPVLSPPLVAATGRK
jgi:hypothetical protein